MPLTISPANIPINNEEANITLFGISHFIPKGTRIIRLRARLDIRTSKIIFRNLFFSRDREGALPLQEKG